MKAFKFKSSGFNDVIIIAPNLALAYKLVQIDFTESAIDSIESVECLDDVLGVVDSSESYELY